MCKKRIRCRGFLLAELMVATALLGLIMAGLAVSLNGFSMVNDSQWARQRCAAAAQAQLDGFAATGRLIDVQELNRLWPGVDVVADRSPGAGPWEGLELIQVTATAQAGPRKITVHLARYLSRASPLAARSVPARACPEPAEGAFEETADDATASVAEGGRS
jgi:type II secretory pathway pseudopilin PulG